MSGNSANQSAMARAARYKRRERLLIVAALALVGCRLLSIRHSVAAMVVATLILVAVFTCYVRDCPTARRWSFRAALPLAVLANALALAIGSLIAVLAMPYVTETAAVSIPEGYLTNAGCGPVAEMLGKLTMLDEIEAPRVPADCERLLHRLPAGSFMQYLSLGGEGVTDETLAVVVGFKRLRKAHFIHSRITDGGLRRLGGLRWLDTLSLRGAPLAGRGLAALASLPSLTSLDLAETEVGDQQIAVLQRFRGLSELDLRDTRITSAGVRKLQATLPRCQIKWP
jgi:hypothetical protein